MIDLRSDTLTQPTEEMRKAMYRAEVGDDARTNNNSQGEDPTVRALEELASKYTGKEDALFCNSGTMANYIGLVTMCKREDKILLSKNSHIFRSELALFIEDLYGLVPVFYEEDSYGNPNANSIEKILETEDIKVICIENTNNFHGGTCLSEVCVNKIYAVAKKSTVPIYLDGARIFNASVALDLPVKDLCSPVDAMMFCLSKGLGAPVGSVLCGSTEFIKKARSTRKLLGGAMRQAGIIAAAGIVALQNPETDILKDHQNAQQLAKKIKSNSFISVDHESVQTNIVKILITKEQYSAQSIEKDLAERGLRVKAIDNNILRMTVYRGINELQIRKAATIFNEYINEISPA
ncbi:GntG family PLP-dependent aldolase [Oceanobacillus sp. CAU 1775]